MSRGSKIVFEQHETVGHYRYEVVSLSNRTRPVIGTKLTEEEVHRLMTDSENLQIEIKPHRENGNGW